MDPNSNDLLPPPAAPVASRETRVYSFRHDTDLRNRLSPFRSPALPFEADVLKHAVLTWLAQQEAA